jgi:chromosome partitioning protein
MGKVITDIPIAHKDGIISRPEGVDLIPTNIELSGMEVSLINVMSREAILKQYLDTVKKDYQYILLDTQPSLGMLTVNTLAAADSVIIPLQAQYISAKGLEQLLQTINTGYSCVQPFASRAFLIAFPKGLKSSFLSSWYIFISPYLILDFR